LWKICLTYTLPTLFLVEFTVYLSHQSLIILLNLATSKLIIFLNLATLNLISVFIPENHKVLSFVFTNLFIFLLSHRFPPTKGGWLIWLVRMRTDQTLFPLGIEPDIPQIRHWNELLANELKQQFGLRLQILVQLINTDIIIYDTFI
jgi:hypothetical protein